VNHAATPEGLLEQDLELEIERGRVVVVVGSGVSVGATGNRPVASWVGLLEDGISRCEQLFLTLPDDWGSGLRAKLHSGEAEDLLSAADEVARTLGAPGGGEYRRWLRETVGGLTVEHREVIAALKDLDVPIATTNYDSLIEEATGLEPVTWRDDARVVRVLRRDETGILHLHGHWEDSESVVLGIHSYDDVLGDARAQFLQQAITAFNSLLFVGCGEGLKDPNFSALRRWLVQFAGWEYRHFRLALQSEARAVAAEHEPAEHIVVVVYGRRHEDLAPFLRKLRPARPPTPEPEQGLLGRLRRPRLIVATGAVLLAVLGLLGVLLFRGSGESGSAAARAIPIGYVGSGDIGGSGEEDVYTFKGTGKTVSLLEQPVAGECVPYETLAWKLVHEDSGEALFDDWLTNSIGDCTRQPLGSTGTKLKDGTYRLIVYGEKGGAYRFTLLPIVMQRFRIAIGDGVATGDPNQGAGEIGKPGELDVYRFKGAGRTVNLLERPVAGECAPYETLAWKLVDEDSGEALFDDWLTTSIGDCTAQPLGVTGTKLKDGAYTLTVYGDKAATGAYRFTLLPVRKQEFGIKIGDSVAPGSPKQGAGEIGKPGELDVYRFSGEGRTVSIVEQPVAGNCLPRETLGWKLVHEDSGETLFDDWLTDSLGNCNLQPLDEEDSRLKGGDYTLTVYGNKGATGAYRFALRSR
jgi:SIR2-like domain